jgi:hypothetical protein
VFLGIGWLERIGGEGQRGAEVLGVGVTTLVLGGALQACSASRRYGSWADNLAYKANCVNPEPA